MRTMSATLTLAASVGEMVLAPNGIRNTKGAGATNEWDVWLGSCLLNEARMHVSGTPSAITVTLYEGIVDSTGVIVVGGAAATGHKHRISISATAGTMGAAQGGLVDPFYTHTAAALSAQLTGLRTRDTFLITPSAGVWTRLPWRGVEIPTGCVLRASIATGTEAVTLQADFVPHASGAFRKRQRIRDQGTATAGGATTLTDATKNWTVNQWSAASAEVVIIAGTGAGQTRTISSNTATQLTVSAWTTNPDATSVYAIMHGGLVSQLTVTPGI